MRSYRARPETFAVIQDAIVLTTSGGPSGARPSTNSYEATVKRILSLLAFCAVLGVAQAEPRYITDENKVMLRAGQGNEYKIVAQLDSGDEVELIQKLEGGYAQVKTKDGKTGYLLSRYLMDEPSARSRVAQLEQQLAELRGQPDQIANKFAALQQEHAQLAQHCKSMEAGKGKAEQELEDIRRISSDAVQIANERMELRKQVTALIREVEELKQSNQSLENSETQRWFLIGGGVLLGGMLLGFILPNMRLQRRKSDWDRL
jgi:SH3 domain protein